MSTDRFSSPVCSFPGWAAALALSAGILAACSSKSSAPPAPTAGGGAAAALTWHHDVRPIAEEKCQSCHTDGGFAPFSLKTYKTAFDNRGAIASAVENKSMPPWPPSAACNSYQHDRSLTDAQRAAIVAWARGDAAEGDPSMYVAPQNAPAPALRVDKSLAASAAYSPVESPDEYRCFVLDWDETTTKYVTGLRIKPGAVAEVHHAIVFQIAPADVAAVQALDEKDPALGYKCFGGTGVNTAGWIGGWAPGTAGGAFPEGSGIAVVPGSKIVVQMHYNTANAPPSPDKSTVELQLADSVKTRAAVVKWANPNWVRSHTMNIPAGDPDSTQSFAFAPAAFMGQVSDNILQNNAPFTIWTASLHMHARGVKGTLTITHADGTKECALEIDDWSFHWQGAYALKTPIVVKPGDTLGIECHFDNSGKRQPVVNGSPAPVGPVNWGETTEDEMCLGFFYATP